MGWPILRSYDADHLLRIAMPLGGIGTGTVSLGGRGDLRDFEIVNRPAKGFRPGNCFFALHLRGEGWPSRTVALEGPLDAADCDGAFGSPAANHGLPRFSHCRFDAAYPLAQVHLSDPGLPAEARIEAFNPLIPADDLASGMPVAVLRFVVRNRTDWPLQAAVCGSLENFIGRDGSAGQAKGNLNEFRDAGHVRGLLLRSAGVDPAAEQWGTIALATTAPAAQVTWRSAWPALGWGNALLDFWDDFSSDGRLDPRSAPGVENPTASLAAGMALPPRGEAAVVFLLTWHFPNRRTWTPLKPASTPAPPPASASPAPACACAADPDRIGNHYTTRWADAWAVAEDTVPRLDALERDTVRFVGAIADSSLPDVVKEAALFNLPALRSQTSFRTPDGHFFGWEGCGDRAGCCHGSCTHVWNYEHATAMLFGRLARSMRQVEFLHATREDGFMSVRVNLPLDRAQQTQLAAADGQMGCIMRLYRDWRLSGDDAFLRRLWPRCRAALEFCWRRGSWDADQDGVMEGCQHNTMDVEYFGPNPQMTGWYLGALRAAEEMARHLGEKAFADRCRSIFDQGSRWMDEHLFNGEYYEQLVRPITDPAIIRPGLRHESMGASDTANPDLQLGAGCLIDQMVGQYTAHVCGLGYLHGPAHVRTTLASILRHNFREDLAGHFNPLRSFALAGEAGTLMATWPRGNRPARPFPYFGEVMSGFEYTAAAGMLFEGMVAEGLKLISAIRARHDGRRRNPFDEPECGRHYARAMAAWSALIALCGFHYDGVSGTICFACSPQGARFFWASGDAWGEMVQSPRPARGAVAVELRVHGGTLRLARLALRDVGQASLPQPAVLAAGQSLRLAVEPL